MTKNKFLIFLFLVGFSSFYFAQKVEQYKGVYNKEEILMVLNRNSDGSGKGYFYNPKKPKNRKGISIYQYAEFINVMLYEKYENGILEEKITEGELRLSRKNFSGFLEDKNGNKIFLQINHFKNY